MSPQLVRILALIFAEQARMEGMKAENAHHANCGDGMVYAEDAFGCVAAELQRLATEAVNS